MLQINDLVKKLGKSAVLDHISLTIENSNYGLLGPNGAGKTTLFRVITGLLEADKGEVKNELGKKLRIGYLPQKFGAFSHLTVHEQLEFFARLKQEKGDAINWKGEIERVISLVHLEEQRSLKCGKLSGGMTRRLGIAQAIMGHPDLILLDEPTAGLDIEERMHLKEILSQIQGQQPLLLSTHVLDDLEGSCKGVIVLNRGRILFQGGFHDLKNIAEGRILLVPEESFNRYSGKALRQIARIEQDGMCFVRCYSMGNNIPSGLETVQVNATVEDAYLMLLNGENKYGSRV